MEEKRLNPDALLEQIKQEEENGRKPEGLPYETKDIQNNKKGRLKIFLGYCAGVGKTYRMLQEGKAASNKGISVAVAIAETHGRKETEALLSGLEIILRKKIEYSGITLDEMDIDNVLSRHPTLVLVDELAHTNAPTSRHVKRYQDVEELLKNGINVFTTLNIQHIESLNDIVQQISGIKVTETLPDSILELADEIELVDLTPEKLLERLKEGKVYIPKKAEQAMSQFFKKGNLLALRELSLKYTAKQVNEDVHSFMEKNAIQGPWLVDSKILVSISASPASERLLRFTRRMANDLDVEWFAVYVESPQKVEKGNKPSLQLTKNINLAEELGAKVVLLNGSSISYEILNFAKSKNVTLIIAGSSKRTRFERIFKGSVIDKLIRESGSIYVLVAGEGEDEKQGYEKDSHSSKREYIPAARDLKAYLFSLLAVSVIVYIGWLLHLNTEPINIGFLLLLPSIASGVLWGIRVGLFTSIIAVCAFDFFFIPPYLTFRIADIRYLPSFVVFVLVSMTISFLVKSIRREIRGSKNRERFVYSLYSFSREIIKAKDLNDILTRAVKNISEAFESSVVIFLPDDAGKLEIKSKNDENILLNEAEQAVAVWVYANGQTAGKGTATLSSTNWYYLPLMIQEKTVGVVGLRVSSDKLLTPDQKQLYESFSSVVALAITKPLN
ncbi:MAG: DUF4118 domain-containing protein [bacterium]